MGRGRPFAHGAFAGGGACGGEGERRPYRLSPPAPGHGPALGIPPAPLVGEHLRCGRVHVLQQRAATASVRRRASASRSSMPGEGRPVASDTSPPGEPADGRTAWRARATGQQSNRPRTTLRPRTRSARSPRWPRPSPHHRSEQQLGGEVAGADPYARAEPACAVAAEQPGRSGGVARDQIRAAVAGGASARTGCHRACSPPSAPTPGPSRSRPRPRPVTEPPPAAAAHARDPQHHRPPPLRAAARPTRRSCRYSRAAPRAQRSPAPSARRSPHRTGAASPWRASRTRRRTSRRERTRPRTDVPAPT